MKPEVELAIKDSAFATFGVYAQYTNGVKRTEWQEGWNAAYKCFIDKEMAIRDFFEKLDEEQQLFLSKLIDDNALFVHVKMGIVSLCINCNDLFFWGCADVEEIKLEELDTLKEYMKEYPVFGISVWCCIKRNLRPQLPVVENIKKCGEWSDELESLPSPPES